MRTKLNLSNILKLSSITLGFILAGEAFSAPQSCTLNGDPVNPNHGGTTAGKTGMVICKDEDGKLLREYELRDGKEIGKRVRIDYQGNREEYSVNEKGNMDGMKKVFNKEGKLIYEGKYSNSDGVGVHRSWYDNGVIKSVHYENKMSIDFTKEGEAYNLHCDREESYTKEDKELCGWDKPKETKLGKRSIVTYKNGHRIKNIEYDLKGNLWSESVVENDIVTDKKFFPTGEVKTVATYKERTPLTFKEYFMNGNLKSDATIKVDGDRYRKEKKTFYDDKTVESEGSYIVMRDYDSPDGTVKTYWQNAKPKSVENYKDGKYEGEMQIFDENGQLIANRTYADDVLKREILYKDNVMQSDFEYLPDGSRKLKN